METSGRTHSQDLVNRETETATQDFQDLVHGSNISTVEGTLQAALLYHSFITDGTRIKQVPLPFIPMSEKRTPDYK